MASTKYNFTPQQINLKVVQGATYYKRWELRRQGEPFPFFDDDGNLLWKATVTIRNIGDSTALLLLDTDEGGVFIEKDETPATYYGFTIEPEVTATFSKNMLSYNIVFERLEDGYVMRLHEGHITVHQEII